jgi:hypothetical protein
VFNLSDDQGRFQSYVRSCNYHVHACILLLRYRCYHSLKSDDHAKNDIIQLDVMTYDYPAFPQHFHRTIKTAVEVYEDLNFSRKVKCVGFHIKAQCIMDLTVEMKYTEPHSQQISGQ